MPGHAGPCPGAAARRSRWSPLSALFSRVASVESWSYSAIAKPRHDHHHGHHHYEHKDEASVQPQVGDGRIRILPFIGGPFGEDAPSFVQSKEGSNDGDLDEIFAMKEHHHKEHHHHHGKEHHHHGKEHHHGKHHGHHHGKHHGKHAKVHAAVDSVLIQWDRLVAGVATLPFSLRWFVVGMLIGAALQVAFSLAYLAVRLHRRARNMDDEVERRWARHERRAARRESRKARKAAMAAAKAGRSPDAKAQEAGFEIESESESLPSYAEGETDALVSRQA